MPEPIGHLQIIGPGRAGLALGAALQGKDAVGQLTFVGRTDLPPAHPLFSGPEPAARYRTAVDSAAHPDSILLIAVPDHAIAPVAEAVAASALPAPVPVLHLSGALGSEVLSPLAARGIPTGSLHPLVAFADEDAATLLSGAWFGVEGDVAACRAAERIVEWLGGTVLPLSTEGKPLYHAAAVMASNHLVALLSVAEEWMQRAGVPAEVARGALLSLAEGAMENVRRRGPVEGLTGPVVRGDLSTVSAHLARLSGKDLHLYSVLASIALELASQRGLDEAAAAGIARLLPTTE